jgi:hypothetical protein
MKAKTQHTPGPWRLNGNGTLLHPVSHRSLTTCRIETSLGSFEILDETNEPEQNAALIASAPDLLQALETIAPQIGNMLSRLRFSTDQDAEILPAIRAAIAKATGN